MIEEALTAEDTWDGWWQAMLMVAAQQSLPINPEDPEAYRHHFVEGLTPLQALLEDLSYG